MKPKMPPKHPDLARPKPEDLPLFNGLRVEYTGELRIPKSEELWLSRSGMTVRFSSWGSKRYMLRLVNPPTPSPDPACELEKLRKAVRNYFSAFSASEKPRLFSRTPETCGGWKTQRQSSRSSPE